MAEAERLIDALTVKLPVTVRVALENMARANYMSMSALAREYIIEGLKNDTLPETLAGLASEVDEQASYSGRKI